MYTHREILIMPKTVMRNFALVMGFILSIFAVGSATTRHVGSGQTYTTIAAGIAATVNGDTVYIHNGTYSENNLSVSAKTGVVIKGESMKGVIMNCTNTSRAFNVYDGCDSIYFMNFTIQNTSASAIRGGGSPAGNRHINFSNMTFQNCVSSTRGGAMDAYYFLNQWRIDTCFFYACSAKSGDGGAIYHASTLSDTLTITNTVFENCYASGVAGAVHEYGCCGPVTVGYVYRCKFINNRAGDRGAGIGNNSGNGSSWWIHSGSAAGQCDFIGNTAANNAQHLNFLLAGGQNAEYCFWDDGTAPANPADANFAITNYATAMLPMNYFPQYQYDTLTRSDPCSVFYSVGTSTSNLMTGTPTVSVSSGVATFSTAQTGNIGAGDMVTLDNGWVFYLKQKTSTTVWTVSAPIGASPNNISSRKVVFIKRAFNSLNAAISGSAPGSANSSHLNTMALTTAKTKLYISCYADGNDASMDTVSNTWTTSASYYITIYTPTNTLTECNQNQRHDGVISGGGYTLTNTVATDYKRNLDIGASYTKVIGLKIIRTSSNWSYGSCIGDYSTTGGVTNCEFAYNLLYQQSGGDYGCLIYNGNISATDHYAFSIHDNILISGSSTLLWGIYYGAAYQTTAARQSKIYNNTVYGSYTSSGGAIRIVVNNSASSSYLPLVKNNYAANTGTGSDYIFGGADYSNANAEVAYNGSDDGTAGTSNGNQTISAANMYFGSTTSGSENLHIKSMSNAILVGIGPSSDANVSAADIDGNTRSGTTTDLGADNLPYTFTAAADPCTLYYSVGTSTNDFKTGSPTMSISAGVATFSEGQTSTSMGVGDMITAQTIYRFYIKKKNSSTEWIVCDPQGRTPSNMSALTVTSIKRAFNSLNAALNGASPGVCDVTHANLSGTPISLITAGKLIFVPCYADGNDSGGTVSISAFASYPTSGSDATHYIRIYTPVSTSTECNQSQRHNGTTASGYKLNITTNSADGITITDAHNYLQFEGLIIQGPGATSTGQGIETDIVSCLIKNCIITGFQDGMQVSRSPGPNIENTIICDCNSKGLTGGAASGSGSVYILNSTIVACGTGAYATSTDHDYIIRNSIFQNNTTDIGGTSADIFVYRSILETNPAAFAGADSENVRSTTLEFLDSTNNNWQLNINDAPAIDIGTDLSGIATYPFSDDIAGTTRPTNGSWDIGASEMPYTLAAYGSDPSPVYFSVGTSTTDKKGSATTIVVTAGAATITGLAGTENIGVGDKIYFGATKNSVYIRGKTDATHWDVSTGNGKKPTISSTSCDSIKRAFNSLNTAMDGSTPGASNAVHLNTKGLVAGAYQLFIPCYADGNDDTRVSVSGWTTNATHGIKIFTPNNTSTECNQTQRHNGTWSTGYRLACLTTAFYALKADVQNNVTIEGLRITATGVSNAGILLSNTDGCVIKECIIKSCAIEGIRNFNPSDGKKNYIINNIIYDNGGSGIITGNDAYSSEITYIYNNTIMGNGSYGVWLWRYGSGTTHSAILKNNICHANASGDYYANATTGTSTYDLFNCISTDGTADDFGGSGNVVSTTLEFKDSTNNDFHLNINDAPAVDNGLSLAADTYYPFSTDIDGVSRPVNSGWDIGASEMPYTLAAYGSDPAPVYYSVGTSTADKKGSATAIVVTAGAATITGLAGTENIGVGDKIYFGATKNSVYIRGKTDATHWDVSTANGKKPTISSTSCDSIKRAFNSLKAAVNYGTDGAANAVHLNTKALTTGQYQLNVACYADGADDFGSSGCEINGWTTNATHGITIFAPNNTSTLCNSTQRHTGVIGGSGYKATFSNPSSNDDHMLRVYDEYVTIDGLYLEKSTLDQETDRWTAGIILYSSGGCNCVIRNNLVYMNNTSRNGDYGAGIYNRGDGTTNGYNNLIYNNIVVSGGAERVSFGIYVSSAFLNTTTRPGSKIYNNTVRGCSTGVYINSGSNNDASSVIYCKNNISVQNLRASEDFKQSITTGTITWGNNLSSDGTADDFGGTGHLVNQTDAYCSFVSTTSGSENLHLKSNVSAAFNAGIGPTSDANVPTPDLDGNTRSGSVCEIGVDDLTYTENACADPCSVFYSVGTSASDFKTAATISITTGVADFSAAQSNASIGVGDMVTFNTDYVVYLKKKITTSQWLVVGPHGGVPTGVSGATVNTITRAFNSLAAAVNIGTDGAANGLHLRTKNLSSNNFKLYLACYADGDDASLTTIDTSWVTSATYYITIFTPTNISTECNTSQRHNGIANSGGYTLNGTDGTTSRWTLAVGARYTKVLGIKIKRNSSNWNYGYAIGESNNAFSSTSTYPGIYSEIAYNLLIQESGGDYGSLIGWTQIGAAPGYGVSVHDNICISRSATLNFGLVFDANYQTTEARQCKIYNNTFYGAADSA